MRKVIIEHYRQGVTGWFLISHIQGKWIVGIDWSLQVWLFGLSFARTYIGIHFLCFKLYFNWIEL